MMEQLLSSAASMALGTTTQDEEGVLTDSEGEWQNITDIFTIHSNALSVGELIHDDSFQLEDAMAAIELMDPKMDTGMSNPDAGLKITSLEQALQAGLPVAGFTEKELIFLMDGMLASFVDWLQGNTLAQTVLCWMHLHNVEQIEDPILKGFCIGLLKAVAHVRDVVMRSALSEEEDFNSPTFGYDLAGYVTEASAQATLDELEHQKEGGHESINIRLKFMRLLLKLLDLSKDPTKSQQSIKIASQASEELRRIQSSVIKGQPARVAEAFQAHVNGHLLGPTPPRDIVHISVTEACKYLLIELEHIRTAVAVASCGTLEVLLDFVENFSRSSPAILSRAKLFGLIHPTQDILGKFTMTDLIREDLRAFNAPPVLGVMDQKHVEEAEVIMYNFLTRASTVLDEYISIQLNNRPRVRRKLAKFFPSLQLLSLLASDVDTQSNNLFPQGDNVELLCFSEWVMRLVLKCSTEFLMLGTELKLYAPPENSMVFWYLSFLFEWMQLTIQHAVERSNAIEAQKAKETTKKKKKKKAKKSFLPIAVKLAEAKTQICKGTLRVVLGCGALGKVQMPSLEFTSLEILYNHRFAPFVQLDGPLYKTYEMYRQQTVDVVADMTPDQVSKLLKKAGSYFQTARGALDEILTNPYPISSSTKEVAHNQQLGPSLPSLCAFLAGGRKVDEGL